MAAADTRSTDQTDETPTPVSAAAAPSDNSIAPNEDLSAELARVRAEKDALEGQYKNLVTKLTTMRQTLGTKMQQDADELDRRAEQIAELSQTCSLLRSELEESQEENHQLSSDAQHAQQQLQDALDECEKLRNSSETAEVQANQHRTEAESARQSVDYLTRELESAQAAAEEARTACERHRISAENLQNVLHEFQVAQDQEVHAATTELRDQLQGSLRMLAEYKQRALAAESSLQNASSNTEKTETLEKQVKEKQLLIGKLRHEAVILNEHLVEALRRLKNTSSDTNVDRRLVTNVLISFFNTPRADTKRFEILQLLASVLQWDDEEKERVGLQKSSAALGRKGHNRNRATSGMPNISSATLPGDASSSSLSLEAVPSSSTHGRTPGGGESMDFAANESFSNLWIEYLLRESGTAAASAAAASQNGAGVASATNTLRSPPLTGSLANLSLSPPFRGKQTSPSIISSAAGSSTAGSNDVRDTPASSVVSEGKL